MSWIGRIRKREDLKKAVVSSGKTYTKLDTWSITIFKNKLIRMNIVFNENIVL